MAITNAQQARQLYKKGSKEPVKQAGVMNYMPSEMVTVPKIAKSSPDTPTAKLAYITPEEQDILIDLNLYGSLDGKPNRGPGGIPSLEGDFGSTTGGTYSGGSGDEKASGSSTNNQNDGGDSTNRERYITDYSSKGKVKGGGKKKKGAVDTNNDGRDDRTGEDIYEDRTVTREEIDRAQSNFREQFNNYSGGARMLDPAYSTFSQRNNQRYQNRIFNQARTNIIEQLKQQGLLTDEDDDMTVQELRDRFQVSDDTKGADYGNRSLNLDALTGIKSIQDYVDEGFYKKGGDFDNDPNNPNYDPNRIPGPFKPTGFATLDFLGKKMAGPLTQEYLTKQFNNLEDIGSIPFDYDRDTSINALMEEYEPNRFKLQNSPRETGPSQQQDPCKGPNPPAYCNVNNDPADPATPTRNLGGLAPRFAGSIFDFTGLADGGRAGKMDGGMMEDTPEGGIMDLESGRQMYFLGKLVKKATRAVKKVAKSPFGKAALGAALFKFGGGFGGGKGLSSFFGKGSINPLKALITTTGQDGAASGLGLSKLGQIFNKFGMATGEGDLTLGGKLGLGFGIPFALDALGVGKDKDDDKMDLDEYYRKNSINIADIRNNPYNFLAPRFAADGGLMRTGYQEGGDAEPVAKKTMPLLDMDGMEKDYREDGGFVPIGRMERADDVPARLSKNEFVFTADAVRNAGEGDIDKGAEVMYNMMKNLESGGEVSEESQGLDGAREMFQTSKRLEEVL